WDSVEIKSDIELGGTEQLYSFMLARDLQKDAGINQQIGIMSPILVGLDGVRRMGKSLGNYIGISEEPYEMMKKFMQIPDEAMRMYFELLTQLPLEEIDSLLAGHPKEAKTTLAKSVIDDYHATGSGAAAADRWQQEIGDKSALPQDIPTVKVAKSELEPDGSIQALKLLMQTKMSGSSSDARRLIGQGGMKLGEDKTKVESIDQMIAVEPGLLVWAGKKKVCRIELLD
ncbi:MAG: tyrosine--tRNA ligase, partial [Planctomycetaceae bacterium]|nr:tyrosine--tRNA ligase [Planctomycetaceae bacterium]